jgi:hypothetical protein
VKVNKSSRLFLEKIQRLTPMRRPVSEADIVRYRALYQRLQAPQRTGRADFYFLGDPIPDTGQTPRWPETGNPN